MIDFTVITRGLNGRGIDVGSYPALDIDDALRAAMVHTDDCYVIAVFETDYRDEVVEGIKNG